MPKATQPPQKPSAKPSVKRSLAPRQARSRESERKLLQAAVAVLAAHGLEGATIPRIAAQAGLTPGAVYRRFPDKTALLETVTIAVLEGNLAHTKRTVTPAAAAAQPLPQLMDNVIGWMIAPLRSHVALLRAMRQLMLTSAHQDFRNKASRIQRQQMEHLIEVLCCYRRQIRHPDPKLALSLALTALAYTLSELFLVDMQLGDWPPHVPQDDAALRQELVRMFLGHLGYQDA